MALKVKSPRIWSPWVWTGGVGALLGENAPNTLTLLRIFAAPVLVVILLTASRGGMGLAAFVFAVAALTDWLDGHLARRRGLVTNLGKVLDPIADKLLVTSALIPLVALGRAQAWVVVVIVGREMAVTGLRAMAGCRGLMVSVSTLGKGKMVCEVAAILFLILDLLPPLGTVLLWAAMVLALVSAADYFVRLCRQLTL
ncbi:MAG: CDP-diacylglycerol--glycerol-3-phosphate 3-phosphatidyltransferase [Nitrospinota bacterium]